MAEAHFRSARVLANVTTALLGAYGLSSFGLLLDHLGVPGLGFVGEVQFIGTTSVELPVLVFLAAGIAFLFWIARVNNNLPSLGEARSYYPPVGSWFIPIGNLFVPFVAVREIWRKSGPKRAPGAGEPPTPVFMTFWWASWIIVSCGGMLRGYDDDMIVLQHLMGALGAGLCATVVQKLTQRQEQMRRDSPASF